MKELTVISGKGGTGKTSLTGCFAALSANSVFTDCDVDAANLSLIMHPVLIESNDFYASRKAFIQLDKCNHCGLCKQLCRFSAISDNFIVERLNCEGCGVCYHACPEKAIQFSEVISGKYLLSETRYGPLVHARLGIAEENSGKLVTLVRQKAKEIAEKKNKDCIINDGPPGIGCPVIASLSNTDLALIVTEPSLSARHDMERVLTVCRQFSIPSLVCINRFDLNEDNTKKIEAYCQNNGVPIVGMIPLDRSVTEAMIAGVPVVEHNNGPAAKSVIKAWKQINYYF